MRLERLATLVLIAAALLALPRAAAAQCQVAKLLASNAALHDEFGSSVAIDGDWVIVGAPVKADLGVAAGAAFAYHRVNGTWSQTQELLASDGGPSDQFGNAVAISGDTAVIGAWNSHPLGISQAGSIYVFELVGSTWVERSRLWASNAANGAMFGRAVAISNGRIVVGAPLASPVSSYSGEAYVFEGSGTNWIQAAILIPSDAGQADTLGSSVAIAGDRLIVGAPQATRALVNQGVAYVFERTLQGAWMQTQELAANDAHSNDFFGGSVAISADAVLSTSTEHSTSVPASGVGYFFALQGTTWVQIQELAAADANSASGFGGFSSIQGDWAVLTADSAAPNSTGAAYVFHRIGGTWAQIGKFLANDGAANKLFGTAIGLSGTSVIVGDSFDNTACPQTPGCNSGSAYVFELAPTAVQYGWCSSGAPCGNTSFQGGCRNSTGKGATIQACGSGSVTSDDLVLQVRRMPPGTSGLLYMGGGQTSALFGDGKRLVAGGGVGTFRLGIQQADSAGVMTRGPGIVAQSQNLLPPGNITAGQTWNFQCWYRNLVGPCGTGFNLSNGLQVSFTP